MIGKQPMNSNCTRPACEKQQSVAQAPLDLQLGPLHSVTLVNKYIKINCLKHVEKLKKHRNTKEI